MIFNRLYIYYLPIYDFISYLWHLILLITQFKMLRLFPVHRLLIQDGQVSLTPAVMGVQVIIQATIILHTLIITVLTQTRAAVMVLMLQEFIHIARVQFSFRTIIFMIYLVPELMETSMFLLIILPSLLI